MDSKKACSAVYSFFGTFFSIMFCVFLIFTFFFRFAEVSGHSMQPNLSDGDRIIVSDLFYKPHYGDVIVVNRSAGEESSLIKRVIALPGDEINIDFETHLITVNNRVITEKYRVNSAISRKGDVDFPVKVPENCVFVLGDNRNNSLDSRFSAVGFIDYDSIEGRVVFRVNTMSLVK